ncbi:MAG: CHAT domain-containing tetratricopeptide repeat protein [Candidatus Solibacter sp.]
MQTEATIIEWVEVMGSRALQGLLVLSAFTLAGCFTGAGSLDAEFRATRALLSAERYEEALPKAEKGLSRAERSRNQADIWRFRLLQVDILIGQRLAAKTLALLDGFGPPPDGLEWKEVRGRLLLLRGRASYTLNRLGEAQDSLARAAVVAREAGAESLAAEVLMRQGSLLVRQSRYDDARRAFQKVADTAVRLGEPYQEASAIGNMGYSLLTESRHDEAIPWFERAVTLFTKLGAGDSVARTHGNLGVCYFRLGDYDNARLHYQNADHWFARTGNKDSQQIWIGNAANVSYQTGDYVAAEEAYKRALEIARQVPSLVWIPRWLANLAVTSLQLGKWDAAEAYNNEALEKMRQSKDPNWEPTALVNGGRIEEGRGRLDRAGENFRAALEKPAEDPGVALDAHAGLARLSIDGGRIQEAEAEFRNTVALIEKRGARLPKAEYKLSYLSSLIRFYRDYVDFLVSIGQAERALGVAESSRSHVLLERLEGGPVAARHGSGDFRRLARRTQSVLLEYWLGPVQSYVWVVTPERVAIHKLPPADTIKRQVDRYLAVIAGGRNPLEVARETGRALYSMILEGALSDSAGASRFVIVPDGILHSLPLESLPAKEDSGKFWIEFATVSVAPSLNFVAGREDARKRPGDGVLIIGEPSSSSPQYPRLEFAAQEIDSIAATMGKAKPAVFRGDAATPDSYRGSGPERYAWIHLTAHAAVNRESPLDSAVILAGPVGSNRLLARDVMALPLTADLVTISACRSAGGKSYAGEGLVGFAWAFLRAGARQVVAGLWDVNDRSTAELMAVMYREIAEGRRPADALRTAKLVLIHSGGAYVKPFYWAPFQLYVGSAQ